MEQIAKPNIEDLLEGLYLATSGDILGLVAQGRMTLEIARDVSRELLWRPNPSALAYPAPESLRGRESGLHAVGGVKGVILLVVAFTLVIGYESWQRIGSGSAMEEAAATAALVSAPGKEQATAADSGLPMNPEQALDALNRADLGTA